MGKKRAIKVCFYFIMTMIPGIGLTQLPEKQEYIELLCKHWVLDSISIPLMDLTVGPPPEMAGNYLDYKRDGTFESIDRGVLILGKWELNGVEILNYQENIPELPNQLTFNIVGLNSNMLSITSQPAAGHQMVLIYRHFQP